MQQPQSSQKIISGLVVVALILLYVVYRQNVKAPTVDTTTTPTQQTTGTTANNLPASYKSYTDPTYGFTVSYDGTKSFTGALPFGVDAAGVKSMYVCTKAGKDYAGDPTELKQMGFSDVSKCTFRQYGLSDTMPTVDMIVDETINHKLRPFGLYPKVETLTLSGQQARIVTGDPQNPETKDMVMIAIQLPKPPTVEGGETLYVLTLNTTPSFVSDIVSSFKFN